jgi:hypothetical protein
MGSGFYAFARKHGEKWRGSANKSITKNIVENPGQYTIID